MRADKVAVEVGQFVKGLSITVVARGMRRAMWRLGLAGRLFQLASWIGGFSGATLISPMDKLELHYDHHTDVLTINGMRYAGGLFRGLSGIIPTGMYLRIVSREDGVITLEQPAPGMALVQPDPHRLSMPGCGGQLVEMHDA